MNTRKVMLLGVMCKVKIYQEGGCHIKLTGVAKFNLVKLPVKKIQHFPINLYSFQGV